MLIYIYPHILKHLLNIKTNNRQLRTSILILITLPQNPGIYFEYSIFNCPSQTKCNHLSNMCITTLTHNRFKLKNFTLKYHCIVCSNAISEFNIIFNYYIPHSYQTKIDFVYISTHFEIHYGWLFVIKL